MKHLLHLTLDFLPLLPSMVLAYLPVKPYLKLRPPQLAIITTVVTLLLCMAGGAICFFFSISTWIISIFLAIIMGILYVRTLNINPWKSISIFLAVWATFTCFGIMVAAIDSIFNPSYTILHNSLGATIAYNLLCCAFVLISWYPTTHAIRNLLYEDAFVQTWYIFWILPVLFILLSPLMHPIYPEILNQGRIKPLYIILSLFLFFLLMLFYALFYFIASSLNKNNQLRQENHFLVIQQQRYDNLKTIVEETREMRHNLRHHFDILLELAQKQEWEKLTEYISNARGDIPATELHLCDNAILDSIAGHYALLFQTYHIPFCFEIDLPSILPVPEIDLCMIFSNLLENALEASLKLPPSKRQVRVQSYLHSQHIVLLTVENTFNGEIHKKNGSFQSTKHDGPGIGISSIQHTAEKSGGYTRFFYDNKTFHANVMLRAEISDAQ